ncbi:MAG: hypothetical protein AB1405_14385 [Bdellovibrionota bacterium]
MRVFFCALCFLLFPLTALAGGLHDEWDWTGNGVAVSISGGHTNENQSLLGGFGTLSIGRTFKSFEWDILELGGYSADFPQGGSMSIGSRMRLYPFGRTVIKSIRISPYLVAAASYGGRCETDDSSATEDFFDILFDDDDDSDCVQTLSSMGWTETGVGAELGFADRDNDFVIFGEASWVYANAGGANAPAGRRDWEAASSLRFGIRYRVFDTLKSAKSGPPLDRLPEPPPGM